MATAAQIRANRENGRKSTGPKDTSRTRYNGTTHGLCGVQVVIPGESREGFDAHRDAWFGDWRPMTYTRAILVERAAVASWKLQRAARTEAARLYDVAADVAHDFDTRRRGLVEAALGLLPHQPQVALARFRSDAAGLDCLIGLWDDLARAVEAGWTSRADHHDRLLNLLGHPAGSDPKGLDAARASLALLLADGPDAPGAIEAAATIRGLCAEQAAELRRERSAYWDPAAYRRHLVDAAIAPTSKEAQLMHRYEMAHEKSLHAAIRQLIALEKSGADLPDEPAPQPPAGPETRSEAVVAASPGPNVPGKNDTNDEPESVCDKLASVGAPASSGVGPEGSVGAPSRRRGPIGADPGPEMASNRR